MKHLFTIILLSLSALSIHAQNELQIGDIDMVNLGDGRLFARDGTTKDAKPINGRVRIITGYTTEYIDAGFDNGYADGKWDYYKNNHLAEARNYSKGYLDGDKIVYNSDDNIKEKDAYKNGKMTAQTTYYTDGSVEMERFFDDAGKQNGTEKRYEWQTNKLKADLNYVHGKQVGKQVRYMTSSLADYIETSNYNEAGQLDGNYSEVYAENNKDKVKGQYVNGKKNGKWVYSDFAGKTTTEETYNNGQLTETKRF